MWHGLAVPRCARSAGAGGSRAVLAETYLLSLGAHRPCDVNLLVPPSRRRRPRLGRSQAFDSSRTPDPRELRSTLRMTERKFLTSPSLWAR